MIRADWDISPSHRYLDEDDFDYRYCRVIERNGNLTLVEDEETGEEKWVAPHEIER